MTTITLRPDLWERLKQIAVQTQSNIQDLADAALDDYLDRLAEQKLATESDAFEKMHPTLLKEHPGEYVAVHERQVVDSDPNFEAVFVRVQSRFGQTPVLIRQVTESPAPRLSVSRPPPHSGDN